MVSRDLQYAENLRFVDGICESDVIAFSRALSEDQDVGIPQMSRVFKATQELPDIECIRGRDHQTSQGWAILGRQGDAPFIVLGGGEHHGKQACTVAADRNGDQRRPGQ